MIYTAETAPSLSDSWVVYTLAASFAPEAVRYVGITNDLRRRLSHHINGAVRCRTRKSRWIVSVGRRGGHVVARVLRSGLGQADAKSVEMELIADFRQAGADLTNLTDGGDGASGHVHSAAAREKMAAARRGTKASDEVRRKMSEARKGRPSGRAGKTLSDASKAKIAASVKAALARPETKAKQIMGTKRAYASGEVQQQLAEIEKRSGPKARNKTGFKGVSYCSRTRKWVAQIKAGGRRFIGRFPTPEAAAHAYDEAAKAAWGSDCYLNFN